MSNLTDFFGSGGYPVPTALTANFARLELGSPSAYGFSGSSASLTTSFTDIFTVTGPGVFNFFFLRRPPGPIDYKIFIDSVEVLSRTNISDANLQNYDAVLGTCYVDQNGQYGWSGCGYTPVAFNESFVVQARGVSANSSVLFYHDYYLI